MAKRNNIFIIICLFLSMTTISIVSANNVTYNNPQAFLNDLNNLQDNSTITINSGVADVSNSYTIQNNNIKIVGNGEVKLNGNGNVQFKFTGTNVTIQGLTFANFKYSGSGGAIIWYGVNGTFIKNTFINCSSTSSNGYGGAINWAYKENGKIINNTFINCKAVNGGAISISSNNGVISGNSFINCQATNTGSGAQGGAILIQSCSNITIIANNFTNCSVSASKGTMYGSAIYFNGATNKIINGSFIKYNNFDNCVAGGIGGIFVNAQSHNVYISFNNFTNCCAVSGAGAICYFGNSNNPASKNGRVFNNTFINCTATGSGASGGAISWGGDDGKCFNNTFINGSSNSSGGAIKWTGVNGLIEGNKFINIKSASNGGVISSSKDNVKITNNTFLNCTTGTYGGAILIGGKYGNISLNTFINCSASYGAAISSDYYANNITIINNKFTNSNSVSGTIWWMYSDSCHILNNIFTNCSSSEEAGAICFYISHNNVVNNNSFLNCSADCDGGVIYFYTSSNNELTNNNFTNCKITSKSNSGVVYFYSSDNNKIANNQFINCSASDDAGAIYFNASNNNNISNNYFFNCVAGYDAGALYFYNSSNNYIVNNDFKDCKALNNGYGGAIYFYTKKTIWGVITGPSDNNSVIGNNFTNCYTEKYHGGAIYWDGKNGTLMNNIFVNCKAIGQDSRNGGAVAFYSTNGVIIGNEFYNCSVTGSGGAVYIYAKNVNITLNSFVNCSAGTGGAISSPSNSINLRVYNNNFTNCTAKTAGAIHSDSKNVILMNNIFRYCKAISKTTSEGRGGAIAISNNAVNGNVINNTFIDCISSIGGGSIYWLAENGTLINNSFTGYSNTSNGGAVFWNAQNGVIAFNNFTNFNSTGDGGAISSNSADNLNISNNCFINCTTINKGSGYTGFGGAILISANNGIIDKNVFINCTSINKGGAISTPDYYGQSFTNITISNNIFIKCIAGSGGAIYYYVSLKSHIFNNNFTNCIADSYGGAIFYDSSNNINISNNNFNYCSGSIGGALEGYLSDNAIINNNNFTNNIAGEYGGAIVIESSKNTNIYNNNFTNSTAKYGGAIHYEEGSDNNIVNNTFKNNTGYYNETIYNNGDNLTVSGGNGGIIYNNKTLKNTVNVTVLNNETITVVENQNINLTAVITTENYTVIGSDFKFNLTNNNTQVSGLINNTNFIKNYTVPSGLNRVVIGAKYTRASSTNYKTGTLIIKKATTIKGDNQTIPYNETITIKLNITNGNADINEGKVYITLKDKNYTSNVTNGKAEITLPKMDSGIYELTVIYNGTDDYAKNSTIIKLNITKIDTPLNITVEGITYGENATVKISIYDEATGKITIKINNSEYTEEITNGKVKFTISGLDVGEYEIIANYTGDNNFNNNTNKSTFKVNKADIKYLNVTTGNINYGENLTVIIKTKENITANLTLTINNTDYDFKLVDGSCTVKILNLQAGNYDITVTINDNRYNKISNNTNAIVNKINTPLNITVDDINYGENATIIINVDKRATGNITIKVDGVEYIKTIKNGKVEFTISGLDVGEHEIIANYTGDNNFNNNTNKSTIKVNKADIKYLNVTAVNTNYGENLTVIIKTKDNITANLTLTINNTDYDFKLVDGSCTVEISNLQAGNYEITATINDNRYNKISNNTNAIVNKINTPLNITVDDINYGEKVKIIVNVDNKATGNITIKINGTEYTETIKDGKIEFRISGLVAGEYGVIAKYEGDNNFKNNTNNSAFTVSQITTPLIITANDIVYGENATIIINVDNKANGTIIIKINGTEYTETIKDGKVEFTFSNLDIGEYEIIANYTGDNNFKNNLNKTTLTVNKATIEYLNITVDDISYGEDLTVIIKTKENITANLTVTVNNTLHNLKLVNGKCTIEIPNLQAGNYNITVSTDDDRYNKISNNTTALVKKINTSLNINVSDIKYGENATITINVDKRATGNISIKINNKEHTKEIKNNKVEFIIPDLISGEYELMVYYNGDKNFNNSTNSSILNVNKINTELNIAVNNISYGENATLTIKVDKRATGNITIIINNKKYNSEIRNGIAEISLIKPNAGTYELIAIYDGDNNFNNAVNNTLFTIDKVDPTINVTVKPDVIIITIDKDATGNISVEIDGVIYTGLIKNGVVVIPIPSLLNGEYNIFIVYNGDDNHNSGTVNAILDIENDDNSSSKTNKSYSINSDIRLKTGNPLIILEALLILFTLTYKRRR